MMLLTRRQSPSRIHSLPEMMLLQLDPRLGLFLMILYVSASYFLSLIESLEIFIYNFS